MNTTTPVRRVIRKKNTGQFLAAQGWTSEIQDALQFRRAADAIGACKEYDLSDVELLLDFGDAKLNVTVPICDQ